MGLKRLKGWNHGYLGAVLIFVGVYFNLVWLIILGLTIVVDELYQIISKNQYGGILHWLYIKTLYKIPFVKRFGEWMDKLFGGKNE